MNKKQVVKSNVVVKKSIEENDSKNSVLKSKLKYIIDNDLDVLTELKKLTIVDVPTSIPESRLSYKKHYINPFESERIDDSGESKHVTSEDVKIGMLRQEAKPFKTSRKPVLGEPKNLTLSGWQNKLVDMKLTSTTLQCLPIETYVTDLTCLTFVYYDKNTKCYSDYTLSNKTYIESNRYKRTDSFSLFPTELVKFSTATFDVGLLCSEIYDKDLKLNIALQVDIKDSSENVIHLGESFVNHTTDDSSSSGDDSKDGTPSMDINMSSVKDSSGNVYILKKGVSLSQVNEYLNESTNGELEPTNKSKQITDENEVQDWPTVVINNTTDITTDYDCNFTCYVKGFLIFSSYIGGSVENRDYGITMIWLNQPTMVKMVTTTVGHPAVIIDKFLSYIEGCLTLDFENCDYELPLKSSFFQTNKSIGKDSALIAKFRIFSPQMPSP